MHNVAEKIIKPKLGLLELARELGNVSRACKVMGYSRDSFYRYKALYENRGSEALQDMTHKRPNEKNRVPEHVEEAVRKLAVENPALGQTRASLELLNRGVIVSSSGIRSIWFRNDLETFNKRLKALEAKSAQGGKAEHHAYELYLSIENIEHSKTKARHPQTNGIMNWTSKHFVRIL